eukprot:g55867.t1
MEVDAEESEPEPKSDPEQEPEPAAAPARGRAGRGACELLIEYSTLEHFPCEPHAADFGRNCKINENECINILMKIRNSLTLYHTSSEDERNNVRLY